MKKHKWRKNDVGVIVGYPCTIGFHEMIVGEIVVVTKILKDAINERYPIVAESNYGYAFTPSELEFLSRL